MGRLKNFKTGTLIDHALSTAIKAYEVPVLARGRRNTVSAAHGGHASCYYYNYNNNR